MERSSLAPACSPAGAVQSLELNRAGGRKTRLPGDPILTIHVHALPHAFLRPGHPQSETGEAYSSNVNLFINACFPQVLWRPTFHRVRTSPSLTSCLAQHPGRVEVTHEPCARVEVGTQKEGRRRYKYASSKCVGLYFSARRMLGRKGGRTVC